MPKRLSVKVDLARVAANAQAIRARMQVKVIAVVKADGYGLGLAGVVEAVGDWVDEWCVFGLGEAVEADLYKRTGKETLVIGPAEKAEGEVYARLHARPAVCNAEEARALAGARPALCVDVGMQRFACPPARVNEALAAGNCKEAFCHATTVMQVQTFAAMLGGKGLELHAAGSSLMGEPACALDAVRPGLALYAGAMRASSRLLEVHETRGLAGYSGFSAERHGVFLGGYADGLRKGVCLVNGARRKVLEVGMQSSYVEIGTEERVGDEVVLLGEGLGEVEVAAAWGVSPQEALVRLGSAR